MKNEHQLSRRDFLKKVGYAAPAILTLTAVPAFATNGSPMEYKGNNGIGQFITRGITDPPPPGLVGKPGMDFNDGGVFTPPSVNGASQGFGPWSSSN